MTTKDRLTLIARTVGRVIGSLVIFFLTLFPLAWLVLSGFKPTTEVVRNPFQFFPEIWTLDNYHKVFANDSFTRAIVVTFVGALIFALMAVVFNSLAAYALARLEFPFKRVLWVYVLMTMFIPGMAILLTSFIVVSDLAMLNTLWVLLLPASASGMQIFFLRQFFLGIPEAIEEAALIDGCGPLQVYTRVILPLTKPALVVVGIVSFLAFWNSYVWPIMTITDPSLFQVQQVLATFRSGRFPDLGLLMAGSFVAALPAIILFLIFQRNIIEGARLSGLK